MGFSALCSYEGMIFIYEHTSDTDFAIYDTIYQQLEDHLSRAAVWIYMPMDENEYLEAVFVRMKVWERAIDQSRFAHSISLIVSLPLTTISYS